VSGPTRGPTYHDEQPTGPLMIQGDHGPVAIRNLAVNRYTDERLAVEDIRYQLYSGAFTTVGEYDDQKPVREGTLDRFSHTGIEKHGNYALVFT
jgi:hypothetical protein